MIYDSGHDEFRKYLPQLPQQPIIYPWPSEAARIAALEAKVAEFEKLLAKAKKYDEDNDEPNCELEPKKKALAELAKQLDVEIRFPA